MRKFKQVLIGGCGVMALALSACGGGDTVEAETEEVTEEAEAAPVEDAAEETTEAPAEEVSSAPADPIRGPGGLEEKCLAEVNSMVGGNVIGTNRIEEAESGVAIFVNVDGATAPWRCFGYRDGTVEEVMFTGDEGAL